MVWRIDDPQGNEAGKIWHLAAPYVQGVALDIGCGPWKMLPHMLGLDSAQRDAGWRPDIDCDGGDLSLFADGIVDAVFSSHLLEHFDRAAVPAVLAEWWRVIWPGGHLVLYLPSANLYPLCGQPGSNPDHKWDIREGDLAACLDEAGIPEHERDEIVAEERSRDREYSWFHVIRKLPVPGQTAAQKQAEWRRRTRPLPPIEKRAVVLRWGGIGDTMVAASVLPALHHGGCHVTVITNRTGADLLAGDPNIDDLQVVDVPHGMPPERLDEYVERLAERYGRIINLDHSLEGALVAHPDYPSYRWPEAARRLLMRDTSYLDLAAAIAGVRSRGPAIFYPTREELDWSAGGRKGLGGRCVALVVSGSAVHKVYPFLDTVAKWLTIEGVNVVLLGSDGPEKQLEQAVVMAMAQSGADMARVYPRCGKWSLRQSITFAGDCDAVVGPETGLMHALAASSVPKVLLLSHTTAASMAKGWDATVALEPEPGRASCWPCYRIHHSFDTCRLDPATNAAACASAIAPKAVFDAVMSMLPAPADEAMPRELVPSPLTSELQP